MSHHYRQLYNAKSVVDTAMPKYFKPHNSNTDSRHRLPRGAERSRNMKGDIRNDLCNMEDTLRSCLKPAFCHYKCFVANERVQARPSFCPPDLPDVSTTQLNSLLQLSMPNLAVKSSINLRRTKEEMDIMNRHMEKFVYPSKAFNPRILKSEAESKLLELRVYKAPRRRLKNGVEKQVTYKQENIMEFQHLANEEVSEWLENEVAESGTQTSSEVTLLSSSTCDATEETQQSSKISSCDSAYNESCRGESCRESSEQEPMVEANAAEINTSSIVTPVNFNMKDEGLYVKFMHDLTEDVLKNNIYSNQGLKQLFSRHMEQYQDLLDWSTMSKKVEELLLYWEVTDNPKEWMNNLIHEQWFNGEDYEKSLVNELSGNGGKQIKKIIQVEKTPMEENLARVDSPKDRQTKNKSQEADHVVQELLRELSMDCTIGKQM